MQIRVPNVVHRRALEAQKRDLARGIKRPLWEYCAEEHGNLLREQRFRGIRL